MVPRQRAASGGHVGGKAGEMGVDINGRSLWKNAGKVKKLKTLPEENWWKELRRTHRANIWKAGM